MTTDRRTRGQEVPPVLERYFDGVDGGRAAEVSRCFSERAVIHLPDPADSVGTGRERLVGPDAIGDRIRSRGTAAWWHDLQLCVRDRGTCIVEGVVRAADGSVLSSFIVDARMGPDGLINTFRAFRSPPIDVQSALWEPTNSPPEALARNPSELIERSMARVRASHDDVGASGTLLLERTSIDDELEGPGRPPHIGQLVSGMLIDTYVEAGPRHAAVGRSHHPLKPGRTVQFAVMLTIDAGGDLGRMAMMWYEDDEMDEARSTW